MSAWSPSSWPVRPARHSPAEYPDPDAPAAMKTSCIFGQFTKLRSWAGETRGAGFMPGYHDDNIIAVAFALMAR